MQTARRYDPTKDAKFHVSIATTEEVRGKRATPRPEWTGPKGTVLHDREPWQAECASCAKVVQDEDATPQRAGLSPAVNFAGRSRTRSGPRRVMGHRLDTGLQVEAPQWTRLLEGWQLSPAQDGKNPGEQGARDAFKATLTPEGTPVDRA